MVNTICFAVNYKLIEWMNEHDKVCKSHATCGEHYQFSFTPSGIIEAQTVKCMVCGESRTVYIN